MSFFNWSCKREKRPRPTIIKKQIKKHNEGIALEDIEPGMLIEYTGDGVKKLTTGKGEPLFAVEDIYKGMSINSKYHKGDTVLTFYGDKGDTVLTKISERTTDHMPGPDMAFYHGPDIFLCPDSNGWLREIRSDREEGVGLVAKLLPYLSEADIGKEYSTENYPRWVAVKIL